MQTLSAQAPPQTTASPSYTDIQGLQLTLPAQTGTSQTALVVLNVPLPYATGNNFPGGYFEITVNSSSVAMGGFTYNEQQPASTGRIPVTIAVTVQLGAAPSIVKGRWYGVRGSTVHIDTYAALLAIF